MALSREQGNQFMLQQKETASSSVDRAQKKQKMNFK
jgi:hypothetical protein